MELRKTPVLNELIRARRGPCVSIYLRAEHGKAGCDATVLRFKNLTRQVARSLRFGHLDVGKASVMKSLERLAADTVFWNFQDKGVAVFAAPGYFRVVPSGHAFDEAAFVSERFHVKPLIRVFQAVERFYVLALSLQGAALYAGDIHGLTEVRSGLSKLKFPDFEAYSDGDRHISAVSAGGPGVRWSGRKGPAMFHNYDDLDARRKVDISRYFVAVDHAVREVLNGGEREPVVLVALGEHQGLYRQVSKVPGLIADGIHSNPDAMGTLELQAAAVRVLEPYYESMTRSALDDYQLAWGLGMASDQLSEIGRAASRGRVRKIFIEQERRIPGTVTEGDGHVLLGDPNAVHANDVLEDFADIVARNAGDVIVLPRSKMPTKTGVAAIYRF